MVDVIKPRQDDMGTTTFHISEQALYNACLMCNINTAHPEQLPSSLLTKIEDMEILIRKANPYVAPELIGIASTQIMALLILEDRK